MGAVREPALVASDVDGTLLDPLERVTERTASAVARVVSATVDFVLVTGRPPRWMSRVVRGLGVAGVAVCSNGAVIYDTSSGEVLATSAIDTLSLREVAAELRYALPGCCFAVERCVAGGLDRNPDVFLADEGFHQTWPNRDIHVVAHDELVGKPAVKLLVLHEKLTSDQMAATAHEIVGDSLHLTYSTGSGLLELSARGVTKASGLAALARERGVDQADIVAFGDMPNDIPMLSWAGHGVAMRNAHPEVLKIADEITAANNEDGVAQVLERWWP